MRLLDKLPAAAYFNPTMNNKGTNITTSDASAMRLRELLLSLSRNIRVAAGRGCCS